MEIMDIRDTPVTYLLVLHLSQLAHVQIGSLGEFDFGEGYYFYVGSARKNARSRLTRHVQGNAAKKRWHIDYLRPYCTVAKVLVFPTDSMGECQLAELMRTMPGAVNPVRRFGSSDCRCPSHLFYLGAQCPPIDHLVERGEVIIPTRIITTDGENTTTARL